MLVGASRAGVLVPEGFADGVRERTGRGRKFSGVGRGVVGFEVGAVRVVVGTTEVLYRVGQVRARQVEEIGSR